MLPECRKRMRVERPPFLKQFLSQSSVRRWPRARDTTECVDPRLKGYLLLFLDKDSKRLNG